MSGKKQQKTGQPQTLVYVGPTIKNGLLQQNSVYRGTLPEHIKKLVKEEGSLAELFIDVKELGEFNRKVNNQGSRENQLFKKALGKGGNN
ncbi:hypothetical protein [Mesobacillus thioparans]|uniref:hypothetical protein n=1 Tax=Mesobacillus thioparans TaxID=370439 RepID=UPI0039EFE8EF